MSAFSLLSIGSRAMAANYVALQTTGNNIANANVAGYSRQRVELATAPSQFTGGGYIGLGVDVKAISRSHEQFLSREAAGAQSNAYMDRSRMTALRKLEEVFRPGENGLGHAAGQFLNAWTELASRPADIAARQAVMARADELSDRFTDSSQQMDALQADVDAGLQQAVKRVNSLAQGLSQVNQKILSFSSSQGAPNDLLDERDRLLSQLSEKLQIKTVLSADNTVSVFVGDGRPLVLGSDARELAVIEDPFDGNRSALALKDGTGERLIDSEFLAGGDIAGLLQFQNEDLVHARSLVGQMAASLTSAVNQQQRAGLDLRGQAGQDIFFDLYQSAAGGALPMVRPATTNKAQDPPVTPTVTVENASKLQAAEYMLSWDAASTQWTLQSSLGGAEIPEDQAAQLLGFSVGGTAALDKADRFLLQPVTYAAGFMRRTLAQAEGLAASSMPPGAVPNGNALLVAALADRTMVGQASDETGGLSITDAYAVAIADIGTRVQGAVTAADISNAVAEQAELRRSSADGVNLDEEAARLIQSQQAYQASAKVLQVAQSVFDTLLQAAAI